MFKAKQYEVAFEIAGPAAMFARPDTGSTPVSWPVPTQSTLKGMFETVAFSKQAYFAPQKVEICAPIIYHRYTANYGGPLKKSGTENYQHFAVVLENVCYKVYGEILSDHLPRPGNNPAHQLQSVFIRRMQGGHLYTTPCLGWKDFPATYFGPLRAETIVDETIQLSISSLLKDMYTHPINGDVRPSYSQNVRIEKGVMLYVE